MLVLLPDDAESRRHAGVTLGQWVGLVHLALPVREVGLSGQRGHALLAWLFVRALVL